MTFFDVITRGLLRRPVRTGLTLLGISVGIAAVVALVGISHGFEASWATGMNARGTDLVVSSVGRSLTPKPFSADVLDRIKPLPGIAAASPLLVELMSVETAEMIIVSAREWKGFSWNNLKLVSGRMPTDAHERVVVLGQTAAEVLNKKVGDPIQIETAELTVAGIVDGGAVVENGSVILALPLLQEIVGEEGRINTIDVRVTPSTGPAEMSQLKAEISRVAPEVHAIAASEHIRDNQGYRIVRAMSWGTSLLAITVGVLGVMNTMLMTVFERKQEISILLALGWKRRRIVGMILWESAMLGLLGGIVGVVLGTVGVKMLAATPTIRGLLEPDLSAELFLVAVALSIGVGVVSGLYPAWRSSRLLPSLALQG